MKLTKEAKSFILEMVPDCIKSDGMVLWEMLISNSEMWPVPGDFMFNPLLKDCWNSLTKVDKNAVLVYDGHWDPWDVAESIFNSPNDENELLDAILDFKGFKGRVWEDA